MGHHHSGAHKRMLVHVSHGGSAAPYPCLQDQEALDELQGKWNTNKSNTSAQMTRLVNLLP